MNNKINVFKTVTDAVAGDGDIRTIVTHGGKFHADEVTAVAILVAATNIDEYNLVRTINREEVADIVGNYYFPVAIDFGGGVYDHHQGGKVREDGAPYASAGLIWGLWGLPYIENVTGIDYVGDEVSQSLSQKIWERVDQSLIKLVDAADNGLGDKNFISEAVSCFNLLGADSDAQFVKVVAVISAILENYVLQVAEKIKSEETLRNYIEASLKDDRLSNKRILWLDNFVPAIEFLFREGYAEQFDILAYPSNRGGFSAQCLPETPGGFDNKVLFPAPWRGKTGTELAEIADIKSAIFCHQSGFMFSAGDRAELIEACGKVVNNRKEVAAE